VTRSIFAAFFVLLAASLGACGGSSSETPFPLEPDLSRLDGGPSGQGRYVVYEGRGKVEPEQGAEGQEPAESPAK
jgi:hypothetical protein